MSYEWRDGPTPYEVIASLKSVIEGLREDMAKERARGRAEAFDEAAKVALDSAELQRAYARSSDGDKVIGYCHAANCLEVLADRFRNPGKEGK